MVNHVSKCSQKEKGQIMTDLEKRDFLVCNLLDIYSKCNVLATRCRRPALSFLDKLKGKSVPSFYPDIVISNFHGSKEDTAYYIVLPEGTPIGNIHLEQLPYYMRNSYVKVIFGSVFCLESQSSENYIKGSQFVTQYRSLALLPVQTNNPLPRMLDARGLATLYAQAWQNLDASMLKDYLDKDFHYSSDFVFDDMASRDEYLNYLTEKFNTFKRVQSIRRVGLGRFGVPGTWTVLVKTVQDGGTTTVAGFFVESDCGRILSINVSEMDLPDF